MRLSIVTPSFRQLDWLRLCVASVRDQVEENGPGIEHIIQDAGSPGIEDFAREVGADFYHDGELIFARQKGGAGTETHYPPHVTRPYRLTVYQESDEGMYDAINRGLERASGDILAYLNCDEQYLPGALDEVVEFFCNHPEADVLFGDAILVDAIGKALSYRRILTPCRMHTRLAHLATLSCAMFIRRRVWEGGARFPTGYRMIGDAVFVDGLLERGVRMAALARPLAAFAFTGNNQGASSRAAEESRVWRENGPYPGWLRLPAIALHRLRRLVAGAYGDRSIEVMLFTPRSPATREQTYYPRLGTSWPRV